MLHCCSAAAAPAHAQIPQRYLMGPGPANAAPRVLTAQALPLLGHMHPPFLKIMGALRKNGYAAD